MSCLIDATISHSIHQSKSHTQPFLPLPTSPLQGYDWPPHSQSKIVGV